MSTSGQDEQGDRRVGVRVTLPVAVTVLEVAKRHLVASRVEVLSRAHARESRLQRWVRNQRDAGELDDVNPVLLEILLELDRKLERVLDPEAEPAGDEPAMIVSISGFGMAFSSATVYEKGTYLRLAFEVPVFPQSRVCLLGRVVRSRQSSADSAAWLTAVEFDTVHESDRDRIIEFVLQKERELIRAGANARPIADDPADR